MPSCVGGLLLLLLLLLLLGGGGAGVGPCGNLYLAVMPIETRVTFVTLLDACRGFIDIVEAAAWRHRITDRVLYERWDRVQVIY